MIAGNVDTLAHISGAVLTYKIHRDSSPCTAGAGVAYLGVHMDRRGAPCAQIKAGVTIVADTDGRSGAGAIDKITIHNIAINTFRQTGLKAGVQGATALAIDNHKTAVAAAKGDLICAVIPPVGYVERTLCNVAETHHIGNLAITVLAQPAAGTGISSVVWRTLVMIFPIVTRHYFRITIRPGQCKNMRDVIHVHAIFVRNNIGSVLPLIIVIGHKGDRIHTVEPAAPQT